MSGYLCHETWEELFTKAKKSKSWRILRFAGRFSADLFHVKARPTYCTYSSRPWNQYQYSTMRALTDTETKTLFEKLANYTGRSLTNLLTDTAPSPTSAKTPDRYVFRIQKDRVYYVRESLANLATSVSRDCLLSLGTCLGKFTKTGKFRLHITALDVIAPHARYKVWVKVNGEMPFLYGGHVVKAHVGRWSEDCPEHQGVVVMSMSDTPLVRTIFNTVCVCKEWLLTYYRASVSRHGRRRRRDGWTLLALSRSGRLMWASICGRRIRCLRHKLCAASKAHETTKPKSARVSINAQTWWWKPYPMRTTDGEQQLSCAACLSGSRHETSPTRVKQAGFSAVQHLPAVEEEEKETEVRQTGCQVLLCTYTKGRIRVGKVRFQDGQAAEPSP